MALIQTTLRLLPLAALALGLAACPAPADNAGGGASATTSAAASAPSAGGDAFAAGTGVVARVSGTDITWAQLDAKSASKLVRLRTQAYDLRKQTLDGMIDDQLMESEAKKQGITKDELIKKEVTDKLPEISDEEAKAYFDANPPRGQVDFEQIKARVKTFMGRSKEQEVRTAFISGLREAAGVEIFLEPMRFEVTFDPKEDPVYGDVSAPITIIEFSDFDCPYCSKVNPTMDQIKETYGDKVAIVFRDFPLPMHKDAPKAGEAAQCAHEQGKFWEYHDVLFANQRKLQIDKLKKYAADLSLDGDAFATCLDSGKYTDEIAADKAAGEAVGVSGTPAFFVNGQFINGARPFESFKEIIDAELKAKGLL